MSNAPEELPETVTLTIPRADVKRLLWLLGWVGRIEGWCSINRAIGKFLFVGAITVLVLMSQAFDAIKNLLGFKVHP